MPQYLPEARTALPAYGMQGGVEGFRLSSRCCCFWLFLAIRRYRIGCRILNRIKVSGEDRCIYRYKPVLSVGEVAAIGWVRCVVVFQSGVQWAKRGSVGGVG